MEVRHASPRSLGVTSLVYVGDVPQPTLGTTLTTMLAALAVPAAVVALAYFATRRPKRRR
jgi:hypothetical protein